jgi:hypothetical protein
MKDVKFVLALIFIVSGILFQSCATILGGRNNSIVFEEGGVAEAQVFIDDSLVGNASGKLIVPKQVIQHGSVLEIRADGYETKEYVILRKVHPWYTLGDFMIGVVPLIIDYGNGNILRPSPRRFDVILEKTN